MSRDKLNRAIAGWCYIFTTLYIAYFGWFGASQKDNPVGEIFGIGIMVGAMINLLYGRRVLDNKLRWLIHVDKHGKESAIVFNKTFALLIPTLTSLGFAAFGTHWYYHVGGAVAFILLILLWIWVYRRIYEIDFSEGEIEGEEDV